LEYRQKHGYTPKISHFLSLGNPQLQNNLLDSPTPSPITSPHMTDRTGILLVVSGPSGSGKTTLCRRLADAGEVRYSISCTTRAPRPGEENGKDYHFLTREDFQQRLQNGDFLEHATVHGNLYGSLKSEVISHLRAGSDVVMDIDVQGADQVRSCTDSDIQRARVDLFVMPPSEAELRTRLTGRGTDSAETIALRMANALGEMQHWPRYTYRLISADREHDFARFQSLLTAERLRVSRINPGTSSTEVCPL
jgi:guanylate kinase